MTAKVLTLGDIGYNVALYSDSKVRAREREGENISVSATQYLVKIVM